MATDLITYDKGELRSIMKAFGAMSDEAIAQAKKHQVPWLNICNAKLLMHQVSPIIGRMIELHQVPGLAKLAKLVKSVLDLPHKNSAVVQLPNNYGAVMNLDQTNINNFQVGRANLAVAPGVGLFIQHYAKINHT